MRANLSAPRFTAEPSDPSLALSYIGGRGANVATLVRELGAAPDVDPLSAENALIIGVGPLAGTMFPGSGRVNFTSKSPQTGILGDSNAGGFFGAELRYAGYDRVIITGAASELSYLVIEDDQVKLIPCPELAGAEIPAVQHYLHAVHGPRAQVAAVGPAAEAGVKFAGIFCNLVRAAARTGMGAVMASKGLKAIVVRGTKPVAVSDPDRFVRLVAAVDSRIYSHSDYGSRVALGTTRLLSSLNSMGCLSTRHYQMGRFEHASMVSGEALADRFRVKGKACQSCTIPCSRFFEITAGPHAGLRSEGPEFEGLAAFTSRVGNPDLASGLAATSLCNRLGMDVITTSECISFSMECFERGIITSAEADGLDLSWGNMDTVFAMIERIAARHGFGDVLADGVREAARRIGRGSEELAMHVKGLELFMADPRGIKGYALGNAVASRGGDHLRSEPSFEFTEDAAAGLARFGSAESAFRLGSRGKGRVVKHYEELSALADALDACKNTITNMEVLSFADAAQLLAAATGLPFSECAVRDACERTVNLERCFIASLGIRRRDDTLPRRFLAEPMPEGCGETSGSTVPLDEMLDEYYDARGWDRASGIPTAATLQRLGLTQWATTRIGDHPSQSTK